MIFKSPQNPNSHLTVKERIGPSFPTKHLAAKKLLAGRILDFGCGMGIDVAFLQRNGFKVSGYDPYYVPQEPTGKFDTIICNYVLNVLLPEEQSHVLMAISELLNPSGRAFFTVRRDVKRSGFRTHLKHGCQVYQCNVLLPYTSIFKNEYCEIYEYRHFNKVNHSSVTNCPFCSPSSNTELISESALAYSILMNEQKGNTQALIIPKQHIANYFELPSRVKTSSWLLLDRVRALLIKRKLAIDLVIEIRVGKAAGQKHDHAFIALKACLKETT